MKNEKIIIIFLLCSLSILIWRCNQCYNCLADGQNPSAWLPYSNNDTLGYKSATGMYKKFSISKSESHSQDEYCGHVGSESYGTCYGKGNSTCFNSYDSIKNLFLVSYTYGGTDAVEYKPTVNLTVLNLKFEIVDNTITQTGSLASLPFIKLITINNHAYTNVFEYKNSSSPSVGSCVGFYYQKEAGLLKYDILTKDGVVTWYLNKP